ncbi:MAG: leucine-rich repeat domain-containing protein, partial [Bacteroidaceae bacterium]|nr:leucine-rich repeat domain-containing protein [Bacteroidaceae bacterium]
MKKFQVSSSKFRLLLAVVAMMPLMAFAQHSLSVTNDSAGHLSKSIPDSIKYHVSQLKVAGPLNGNDIKLIQEMILRSKTKEKSEEPFRELDLAEASIVEGKEGLKTRDNEMPDRMFVGCKTLEQVVLPANLINVSSHGFDGCTSLVSVTIPESVTDLGTYAFVNC